MGLDRFPHPETPDEARATLEEGNERFRAGQPEFRDHSPEGEDIASGQKPFAALITCADSRLSPPFVFDVAHGNLFVSRVAGNSIDTGMLGSTEFAVEVLGVKLVMVLGHSDCGAVKAAISVANGSADYPADKYGAIGDVVDRIVPAIRALPSEERSVARGVDVTAETQAADLASREPIVKPAVDSGKLRVVPAVYDIKTGKVSFL